MLAVGPHGPGSARITGIVPGCSPSWLARSDYVHLVQLQAKLATGAAWASHDGRPPHRLRTPSRARRRPQRPPDSAHTARIRKDLDQRIDTTTLSLVFATENRVALATDIWGTRRRSGRGDACRMRAFGPSSAGRRPAAGIGSGWLPPDRCEWHALTSNALPAMRFT